MVPGMSCKSMNGIANECEFCENGIDWKECTNLGWKAASKLFGAEDKNKDYLDHFREVVFKPILEHYSPNLERKGITTIFLTIARRHVHYEYPKNKCDGCQEKIEGEPCKDCERCNGDEGEPCEECELCDEVRVYRGYKDKAENIEIRTQPDDPWDNPERKIICIPMYPLEFISAVDVNITGAHIFECLKLIENKYPNCRLEVNTYTGSSNFGLRSYFHGLLHFAGKYKNEVLKWAFLDYFHDNFIGTDEPMPKNTPAQKKKRAEKIRSGYHVLPSIPSSKKQKRNE